MTPFHCIILNFQKKKMVILLTKVFFFQSFHSSKLLHEMVSCKKNGTLKGNSIEFKIWLKIDLIWLKVKKSSIVDVRLSSKYAFMNITLHLIFLKS